LIQETQAAQRTMKRLLFLLWVSICISSARATSAVGPWIPIFKGVDHSVGTNTPGDGDFPSMFVVHALRIDLTDPDIRLFTTPRIADYSADSREAGGLTVKDFLRNNQLQAAINANFFDPQEYYLPAGTPMDIFGLAISQGVVVSAQERSEPSAAIVFDAANHGTIIHTNWPPTNTAGLFTAVCGTYPLVVNGTNIGYRYLSISDFIHEQNPRTAFGLSQDGRYLFLVTIDGRQEGYSDGSYDYETAGWLLLLGAHNGINMDGGGSTTLVVEGSTGNPVELNKSSAVADSGRERTVGSHFGIFAKPVTGFINDVVALPDDTAATITWSTIRPSTTQVEYGPTASFTNASAFQSGLVTNHTALLTRLTPNTGYYFRAASTVGTNQYVSPDLFFVTTNYVTTNQLFNLTNSWKYTTANLDGVIWAAPGYDDSAWSGPGAALLWVDVRSTGPNSAVAPKNTQMPADPNNSGDPYTTYYFRTHFALTNRPSGISLLFSSFVDDGAVFYLNGQEIYRLRMDPFPTPVLHGTLAAGYPCDGDSTCADEFSITGDLTTNLVAGDNLLAVEVHNYNLLSADITFGTSLMDTQPYALGPSALGPILDIVDTQGTLTLSWSRGGFTVQHADSPVGPWADVPGPVVSSPFKTANSGGVQYYRLIKP